MFSQAGLEMVDNFSEMESEGSYGFIPGFNIRTDLAVEAHEVISAQGEIEGVRSEKEGDEDITVHRVSVLTEQGAAKMGKPMGNYLTLEVPGLRKKNNALQDKVIQVFYKELRRMLNLNGQQSVLVIGLGNWNVTPDALGPRVVQELFVTRHILKLKPKSSGGVPFCLVLYRRVSWGLQVLRQVRSSAVSPNMSNRILSSRWMPRAYHEPSSYNHSGI